MPAASALSLSPCMASAVMAIIGGLLMSGRRLTSDSGEPDLWSNGSVFMGPREPISIDPSPHIPLQQTTAKPILHLNEALLVLDEPFLLQKFTLNGLFWAVHDNERDNHSDLHRRRWTQAH